MRRAGTIIGLLIAGTLLLPHSSAAQGPILDRGGAGVRERARLEGEPPLRVRADTSMLGLLQAQEAPPRVGVLFIPTGVAAEDTRVFGATVGLVFPRGLAPLPLQFRSGYRRFDLEGLENRDRVTANLKAVLWERPIARRESTITAIGDFARTLETSSRYEFGVAAELALDAAASWLVGANGSYVRSSPDSGAGEDAFVPSVGVVRALAGGTSVSLDYVFDNAVDGESDYSLTLAQQVVQKGRVPVKLVFGAGKHRVVFASLVLVL